MPNFDQPIDKVIQDLDIAVQSHHDWIRRLLRYAVLGGNQPADMINLNAHKICTFGQWLDSDGAALAQFDHKKREELSCAHQAMHDSVREIVKFIPAGKGTEHLLNKLDENQENLLNLINEFKTQLVTIKNLNDPLTGLPLRQVLNHSFSQFKKRCKRNGKLFFIALIDVDHFKKVNDNFGHPVGDDALRHLVNTLLHSIREEESLFRFGGEEFLQLLEVRDEKEVIIAAQRSIETVRNTPMSLPDGKQLRLTITMGLARVGNEETMRSALERADAAMYEGKRAGRDRYVLAASNQE